MAEQLADYITQVTGIPEKYPGHVLDTRAMEIPQSAPSCFLATFGRMKAWEVICDRDSQPDMAQAMHLISGETLQRQTTAKNGNLDRWLVDSSLSKEDLVDRMFLAALVREPNSRRLLRLRQKATLCQRRPSCRVGLRGSRYAGE
jgi:hypothetical protein